MLGKNVGNPVPHRTGANYCYAFHVYLLKCPQTYVQLGGIQNGARYPGTTQKNSRWPSDDPPDHTSNALVQAPMIIYNNFNTQYVKKQFFISYL